MSDPEPRPLALPDDPYLSDHAFDGRGIFPAVEALELLAARAADAVSVLESRDAEFPRFIPLARDLGEVRLFTEAERIAGGVRARILSRSPAKPGAPTRAKEHAAATFGALPPRRAPSADAAGFFEGVAYPVSAERLYAELVPFGPAFRNLKDALLTERGAVAWCAAPVHGARERRLGSPFPLDAAFHLACAWGQRYAGIVGFPVGYAERRVLRPAAAGERSFCRAAPRETEAQGFVVDLWRYGEDGEPCEAALGVRMRDVSQGRRKPPGWIAAPAADPRAGDPLAPLRARCRALVLFEHRTVPSFATRAFSDAERAAWEGMAPKRRESYLSARLAVKALARRIDPDAADAGPAEIETVADEGARPGCRVRGRPIAARFAVAHDDRFCAAAADGESLGIDVERVSEKLRRVADWFLTPEERRTAERSPLGFLSAAARAWTAKEAAVKTTDLAMAQAKEAVRVLEIGERESALELRGARRVVLHAALEDHVLTLLPAG